MTPNEQKAREWLDPLLKGEGQPYLDFVASLARLLDEVAEQARREAREALENAEGSLAHILESGDVRVPDVPNEFVQQVEWVLDDIRSALSRPGQSR